MSPRPAAAARAGARAARSRCSHSANRIGTATRNCRLMKPPKPSSAPSAAVRPLEGSRPGSIESTASRAPKRNGIVSAWLPRASTSTIWNEGGRSARSSAPVQAAARPAWRARTSTNSAAAAADQSSAATFSAAKVGPSSAMSGTHTRLVTTEPRWWSITGSAAGSSGMPFRIAQAMLPESSSNSISSARESATSARTTTVERTPPASGAASLRAKADIGATRARPGGGRAPGRRPPSRARRDSGPRGTRGLRRRCARRPGTRRAARRSRGPRAGGRRAA